MNFFSLIGRTAGDYEPKKIRKSNMTFETITDIIHEYLYDRLNNSNNSNNGRDIKYVHGRTQKRKSSEKPGYNKNKEDRSIKERNTKTMVADKE